MAPKSSPRHNVADARIKADLTAAIVGVWESPRIGMWLQFTTDGLARAADLETETSPQPWAVTGPDEITIARIPVRATMTAHTLRLGCGGGPVVELHRYAWPDDTAVA